MSLSHNLSRADGAKMRLAVDAVSLLTFTSIWILVMSGKQILKIDLVCGDVFSLINIEFFRDWHVGMVAAARFMPKGGGTYAVSPLKLFLCVLINCCVSRVYEADFLWCHH